MIPDVHAALAEISSGDERAHQFLVTTYEFIHLLDDLIDRDEERSSVEVGLIVYSFIETIAANEFFQAHRAVLLGSLRSGVISWVASEQFRKREPVVDKLAAEVLKSGYQELFYLVASITGGMKHAMSMSSKYRSYVAG